MADVAKLVAADAARRRDNARRETAQRVINAYYGGTDYQTDLKAVLREVFGNPEKADRVMINLALMRKVADTKAQVFKEAPRLVVVGPDGEEREDETELLAQIATDGRWHNKLRQANTWEQIVGTVHLLPRPLDGIIDLAVLSPAAVIVFQAQDNPQRADGIAYRAGAMRDTPHVTGVSPDVWVYWSAENHFTFEMDDQGGIKILSDPENPDQENPWGILPIVKIDKLDPPDDEYWCAPALDLLSVQNAVDVQVMALGEAVLQQGYSMTWSRNIAAHLFKSRGPGAHFAVENQREGDVPAEMGTVKLDADLVQIQGAIEFLVQQTAVLHNLPPQEFSVEQTAESGFSKMVSRLPLHEERQADVARWRYALAELFEIVKAITAGEGDVQGVFREDSALVVDFADVQMPETEAERIERFEKLLSLKLMSPVDVIMQLNPDLADDREAALAKLQQIADENRQLGASNVLAAFGMTAPGAGERPE